MVRWVFALLSIGTALCAEPPLRVLFLGNSYTYFNNLPGLVEGMARAAGGRAIEAEAVTLGGATLERLYMRTNALQVLRGAKWDVVVLQEHSTLGLNMVNGDQVVNEPDAFHNWVRIWDAEIRARGARTVLLNPWSRKGRAELQPYVDWAYAAIAREIGAGLIPVGAAFLGVSPEVELYQADGTHPSAAGSYVAACAAVEILAGGGCAGAPAEIEGVPMDNATGRLRDVRGVIVRIPAEVAGQLKGAAMAGVGRLREEGGYWKLARPSAPSVVETVSSSGGWEGRWEGSTWFYGKQATVALRLDVDGSACSGTWQITATEPLTQTMLPLAGCSVEGGRLRFTVRTLFLTAERHEAWLQGGKIEGRVSLESLAPYHRQTGTWTLQRVDR